MSTTVRLLVVGTIATVMAVIGMELIARRQGNHTDFNTLKFVIPVSIFMWLTFALILRQRPILMGIYVGFLSPFLGGILVLPPYGFLVVFTNLLICLGVGLTTGILVSLAIRNWGNA